MPANETFFARRARKLMSKPRMKTHLEATTLEDRVVPTISGFAYQDFNANGTFDTAATIKNLGGTNINNPPSPGTVSAATDTGFAGLTVRIFNSAGALVDTKTTAADGSWSSNATVAGQQYRVEYTGLNAGAAVGYYSGPHGTSNATTTQFVTDGTPAASAANLGVVRAQDYYPAVPLLVTPIFTFGGQNTTTPAMISFPYSGGSAAPTATSQDANQPRADTNSPQFHDLSVPANQIGTAWGLAYNRPQGAIYASAFTKRHSNWRPTAGNTSNNSGAIYTMGLPTQATGTTPSITTATEWLNFNQAGLTVNGVVQLGGIDTVGAFSAWANNRSNQTSQAYWEDDGDNLGWDAVGKTSFGGIDTNDAGTEVYLMNLADRRLYVIPVNANGSPNTTAIRSYAIPSIAGVGNQNDVRPFAVEFHEGLLYIGLVNSAESTITGAAPDGDASQLRGYVYTFNPATEAYSANSVVSDGNGNGFSLNYTRGTSYGGNDNWAPWSPTFRSRSPLGTGTDPVKWAQPMISGLTFDSNNNIVISIRDRLGDQTGNAIPDQPGNLSLREGIAVGDTLMSFRNANVPGWTLERNGQSPTTPTPATPSAGNTGVFPGFNIPYGVGSGEGPQADPTQPAGPGNPSGEYFGVDFYGANTHRETSLGSATHIPGFPDIVSTHFDPIVNGQIRSGGVRWYRASDGAFVKGYELYQQDQSAAGTQGSAGQFGGTFGKANGLGDLIAIAGLPPVEIGNRIFQDDDRDGIQDANEAGLPDITVELRSNAGTLIATAKTGADGSYYFNSGADPVPGTVQNEVYNIAALVAGQNYIVRIPAQSGLGSLILTKANTATAAFVGDTNQDARDSDGIANGTAADIAVTTGALGESNHTFDAGFAPGVSLGDFVWEDANNNGKFDTGETKLAGIAVRLLSDTDNNGTPDTVTASTVTDANGFYIFNGLAAPATYQVEITSPAGYRSSTGNAFDPANGPFESGLVGNSLNDNEDHGITVTGDLFGGFIIRTNPVTLSTAANPDTGGIANLRQDFGIYRAYSLGNYIWNDKNNDGLFNNGEAGIDGVTVRLFDLAAFDANKQLLPGATPVVGSTVTALGGFYRFDNLIAGQYVAVATGKTGALANFVSSTGGTSKTTTFEPSPATQGPASTLDNRDEGTTLNGFLVRTGVITLGPGAAEPVNETPLVPPGGQAAQGTLDAQADMTNDFGFYQPLSLGNQIWNDVNNNGILDAGETGLGNVRVTLYRASDLATPLESQFTTGAGYYLFQGLGTDSYVVQVDRSTLPTGTWLTSTGKNGFATGPFEPGLNPNTDLADGRDRGTLNGAFVQNTAIAISPGNAPLGIPATPGFTDGALDADSYRILDFGFYQPLSIGSLVWNDLNNDGKSAGEPGIDGVTVTLYADGNANGTFEPAFDAVVTTTTTKSGGQYLFTNLAPGGYFVEIAPLGGAKSSTGAPGQLTGPYEPGITAFTDNEDHGSNAGAVIRSGLVNLQLGANPNTPAIFGDTTADGNRNYTIDFGVFSSLAVGDLVWNDLNNNGKFDSATEKGISGVTVDLFLAGNKIGTTTTDANGNYLFTDLAAGSYNVRITAPAGFLSSTGANGKATGPFEPVVGNPGNNFDSGTTSGAFIVSNPFNLLSAGNPDNGGSANLAQDFGLFQPLALGDTVWVDANNDGLLNNGETGLANVPVTLLDSTGAVTIATTTTDANGVYGFSNLVQGTYVINIAPGAGYISSTGTNGKATGAYEPGVSGTQNNEDHGTQFDATNIRATATLLATGNPDANGTANLRQDFGVFQPLSLGNFVFNDADNDGSFNNADTKMANVPVTLLDSTGTTTIGTTTTDANGNYGFTNLIPGSYVVRVTPPTGFATSTGKNGSASGPFEPGVNGTQDNQDHGTASGAFVNANVTLAAPGNAANPDAAGFANLRQDFGLFQPLSLGSFVWIDTNNNGKFDTGEQPIGNIPVTLLDGNGNTVATTTTDSKGSYGFTNLLPGTYSVSILPPAGVLPSGTSTTPLASQDNQNVGTAGPNGTIISAAVALTLGGGPIVGTNTDANAYVTFDFGLLALSNLSGYTYFDPNVDGNFTPGVNGDSPLGGTTVTLTGVDANGNPLPTLTTTTDKTGYYEFLNLAPGTYTVRETQPSGHYIDGLDTPGSIAGSTSPSNDVIVVPLAANQNSINNNFGEIPFAGTHGYVWIDTNNNCQKDPGELGLANVPITISGTALPGTPLAHTLTLADLPAGYSLTVLTDASGYYAFPVLPPGNYSIARGDLPVEVRTIYANSCMQNGDPNPNPPTAGNQIFTNITLNTPIRGPFNFGVTPIDPNDPSKRNFLGSSGNTATMPNQNLPMVGGPTRGPASLNPAFTVTTGTPLANSLVLIGTGVGQRAVVRVLDYAKGGEKFRFEPYGAYTGGVRVAQGDVDGDGVQDVITATGQGGGPRIRVFSGATGLGIKDFFAYEDTFRGGVFVASADVDGDGKAEIITGTELGGGPRVRVFNAVTGAVMQDFFAFDSTQRGGVRVAAADFNGDGKADIAATTGVGTATRVRVFNGQNAAILKDYFAFGSTFTLGANIAVGDVDGDGQADILVGTEAGGGPRVQVYSGKTDAVIKDAFVFDSNLRSGVRVGARDINGDGKAEIIATAGQSGAARVRMLDAASLVAYEDFFALDPEFRGGAYVG